MKRLMITLFIGFVFIFFVSFVEAQQACTSGNQIIMRISGNTNAHGETYAKTSSGYENICYKDVFGEDYKGDTTSVHVCAGGNKVLRLSGDTNAHAEIPGGNNRAYSDVCYGDLSCKSINGNLDCGNDYKEVVSLSESTNAHLEKRDAEIYNGAENIKICCSSASASSNPSIYNPIWKYFDGKKIPSLASICPNIKVILSVDTIALPDDTQVNFQIYDDDLAIDDKIGGPLSGLVKGNKAEVTVDLNSIRSELSKALENEEDNSLELYFEASSSGVGNANSGQILYYDDVNMCKYDRPVAKIVAPVHKGVYFSGININFKSGCSSQVGIKSTEWTITQDTSSGANKVTRTEAEFDYPFTGAGQANVKLKCTDITGKFDIAEKQILVVSSPGVLAYINKPSFNEVIYSAPPASGPYFPEQVKFSAGDSFVVDVTSTNLPCIIECKGGSCPDKTENSPASCGTSPIGGPIDIIGAPGSGSADYSKMNFDWKFWDNNWNDNGVIVDGDGKSDGVIHYGSESDKLNDKYMSVKVTDTVSKASASFERQFTLGRCLNGGDTYYDPSTGISLSTTEKNGACKGGDLTIKTADDCCKLGWECLSGSTPNTEFCQVPSGGQILKCEDFKEEDKCNNNKDSRIPKASWGSDPVPACTFLECFWDDSDPDVEFPCGVKATKYQSNNNGCNTGGGTEICQYTTTTTDCINGKRTITYKLVSGDATQCTKSDSIVSCGSLSFELGFFGAREFVISFALILAIYFMLNMFKKRVKDNEN